MLKHIARLSLAIVTLTTCEFAAVTPTQTFTLGQTPESFNRAFSFAQFNPALGTLTGIHFALAGTETSNTTVTNNGSTSGSFTYTSIADIYITDASGNVVYDETFPTTTRTATIPGRGSQTFTGVTASSSADTEFTGANPANFSLTTNTGNGIPDNPISATSFIGTGAVSLFFNGDNVSGCPTATCSDSSGTGGGTVSLYYIYSSVPVTTPTPEPNTMVFLSLALVGFGSSRMRRRYTSSRVPA